MASTNHRGAQGVHSCQVQRSQKAGILQEHTNHMPSVVGAERVRKIWARVRKPIFILLEVESHQRFSLGGIFLKKKNHVVTLNLIYKLIYHSSVH